MSAYSSQINQLRTFFQSGATRSLKYRIAQLNALERFLEESAPAIYDALYQDLRKPPLEVFTTEIAFTLSEIKLARKNLAKWARPKRVRSSLWVLPGKSTIYSEPYGVVLIISPWNFPVQLSLVPLVGAIAAGNCAILKPSEMSSAISHVLATLLPQYLDNNCVKVIEGAAAETTELLNEKLDYIFYTGSESIGKVVMTAAARHLTPVTLELGGKNPCIIDNDIDLDFAARRIALGKFYNAGQTCVAPDYILLEEQRKAPFLEAMKRALLAFYGEDIQQSGDFGRIINLHHMERLLRLLKEGGLPFWGGAFNLEQRYIAPTILDKVSFDSALMKEEIFGPLLPVFVVNDIQQAINLINNRPKPLAVYLFSNNKTLQHKIINETSSGSVSINMTSIHFMTSMPVGGVGASGMGAYHGRSSFDTFSHQKAVLVEPSWFETNLIYPPYTQHKFKWISRIFLRKW